MLYCLSIAIFVVFALIDYSGYKRGGLLYITGDKLAFNKLLLDVKIKITDINTVDIIIDERHNIAYYEITVHRGIKVKTTKTAVGSGKYNHAGKLLVKCGVKTFNTIYK